MILTGKKIIQWSPPRSGSTLVWQILDNLFEDPDYKKNKWIYPNIVQKTHTLDFSLLYNNNYHIFVTMRNPIDCMVSYMIVNKLKFNKEELDKNITLYLQYFNLAKMIKNSNNSTFLRYDQFYDNNNIIYDNIERAFNIKISNNLRVGMNIKFSREKNKEISKK